MIFPKSITMTSTKSITIIMKSMHHSTCLPKPLALMSCDYMIDIDWRMFS
ncbi:hypothetical protein NC653_002841 [Populus alba x Populus x berolinensis]|uniref:Uncharacterized protein n=1 Tax=Populus alba x Populus x berolinensis TaxID=444605 RepID=A0AAD6RPU9_9ROSI|nr:hypothetical protein NC653_002841 [Populus alba x Populus x berolinensis]